MHSIKRTTTAMAAAFAAFGIQCASAKTVEVTMTAKEVDLHLLDHGNASCTFELPGRTIALRGSPEFTHWVVWTLAGKDFVCVEPWTCPGNALNTGDRVITLEPGASRALWLEIEAS